MTTHEAQTQVVAMLEDALTRARRDGAIGVEVMLVHGNTTSCYRYFNADAINEAHALVGAEGEGGMQ